MDHLHVGSSIFLRHGTARALNTPDGAFGGTTELELPVQGYSRPGSKHDSSV